MVLHAASNVAAVLTVHQLVPGLFTRAAIDTTVLLYAGVVALAAVLLAVVTRGRLGLHPLGGGDTAAASPT